MIRRSLFWAAFPWVLPQALWLRKTAPRFSGARGRNSGQIGDGKLCSVLAIGDSVIAGVGADSFERALVGQLASSLSEQRACSVDWIALGKIGATAKTVAEDLVPLIPTRVFDLVVLSVGVNDVTGLTGLKAYEERLHTLVEKLHAHSPSATIVLNGLPPMHQFPLLPQPLRSVIGLRSRLLEEVVDRIANRYEQVLHVPVVIDPDPRLFADDGYHPSPAGYTAFAQAIVDRLDQEEISFNSPIQYDAAELSCSKSA